MPGTEPRLRMAPAPSGFLHLGNVRTFLFDYLYARARNGSLILRIEDTDVERSTSEAEQYIVDSLHWLGIEWDEGPDVGGPHAPYRQSEREASHRAAATSLLGMRVAYECFCTPEELEHERQEQQRRGQPPRYSGRCYHLSEEAKASFRREGRTPSIRFHVPADQEIEWDDLVYGRVSFDSNEIGDFIVLRPNGSPIYNLANVVDDHEMEVTVGLRSQSHLSNTPRQILLYEALGYSIPRFAHVPDVLDLEGRKMGKRYGAKGVTQYRDEGYLPQAVVNYITLLGWSSATGEEFLSLSELCAQFSLDRVQKSNAAFDPARLEWFNGQYIRRLSLDDLLESLVPFLRRAGLVSSEQISEPEHSELMRILPLVRERVRTLAEVPPMIDFFFRDSVDLHPESFQDKNLKKRSLSEIASALRSVWCALEELETWTSASILATIDGLLDGLEWKRGELLMAVRIAVTGRTVTPPLTESMEILGKRLCLDRLDHAVAVLEG